MPTEEAPSRNALTVARALEDPLRADIYFEYQRQPSSPSRVAQVLGRKLNLVAYHTHRLVELGCVRLVRTERRRGAVMKTYATVLEPVIEDEDWMRLPARYRRAMTLTALSAVGRAARAAALHGGFDRTHAHLSRRPVRLDEAAAIDLAEALRGVYERALALEEEAARRTGAPAQYELALLFFEQLSPTETA